MSATSNDTFFTYRGYRWLWANALLTLALIVWYWVDDPLGVPNGGTVYGYTVGGIAAAGIFYLMWYGVRKRSYHAQHTTLKGTLAAHTWLGIALAIIVPLHCGFQFGWNVHTLAYVLMMIVVVSGIWGALYYATLASQVQSHRGGGTVKDLVQQIHITEQNLDALIAQKSDRLVAVKRFVDEQLGGPDFTPKFWSTVLSKPIPNFEPTRVAELLAPLPDAEAVDGLALVQGANRKRELINRVRHEVQTLTKLRVWLYIHLPISCALLVALLIHIFVVFFYRG